MKIAILHEMLIKFGGAEKVVESMLKIFPEADLFTLIYDKEKMGKFFGHKKIITPKVTQFIYKLTKKQRLCFPFMASAVESLDFSQYDLVLCSSSGFAHGAITKPETKFVVYYHAPARYMWDWTNEYKKDIGANSGFKGFIMNKLFLKFRIWDVIASKRVDISLANSSNTAKRIEKYHRKSSIVLYPPIETKRFQKALSDNTKSSIISFIKGDEKVSGNYYIIISALTEFKRLDVAIKAFNKMPDKTLVIIGAGDYKKILEEMAKNNIIFTGPQYGDDLVALVQNSSGLIFPGEEDFGMVPVEAMAAGKPVFALGKGGLLETVIPGLTGEFFNDVEGEDFVENFIKFDEKNKAGFYIAENCIKQAEKFSVENFEKRLKKIIGM